MQCREARRLLNSGVQPGTASSERVQLQAHLKTCAACQAHQTRVNDDLLGRLLLEPPSTKFAPPRAAPVRSTRSSQRQVLHRAMVALLVIGAVCSVYGLGRVVFALGTIRQNIAAMTLASPTIGHAIQAQMVQPVQFTSPAVPSTTATPVASPRVRPTPRSTQSAGVIPTLLPTSAVTAPPSDTAITVLLLGSDGRPDDPEPSRSDAIVVARLDPTTRRIALLSLPRDLIVTIPGYGMARINAATAYGANDGDGGIGLMRRTVSSLLDIPIDYVVRVNFEGFVGAVDAIGGITVNVDHELYDPAYPTMDYGYTVAHFLPGEQQMDGTTALMYSRIRHMDSDFERMQRQQAVLLGIMQRLREENIFSQMQSIASITTALRDYVQTDLPQSRAIGLAWAFRRIAPEAVERYSLDANMVTMNESASDPYAEYARPGAINELVQKFLNGPTP